jgi:hypothetical protein
MLKTGRWRALRNLPVGWLTHANHARDRSEKWFHYVVESVLLASSLMVLVAIERTGTVSIFLAIIIVHSVWWVVNGNCHVYLLDSFASVHNAGIERTISYIEWCHRCFARTGCVSAILIYGSFCRQKFHRRSDLDLRIIRRPGLLAALFVLPMAVGARVVSLWRGVPTDLQVVDSGWFLSRQMRADEHPVVVYVDPHAQTIDGLGMTFAEVQSNPRIVSVKYASA